MDGSRSKHVTLHLLIHIAVQPDRGLRVLRERIELERFQLEKGERSEIANDSENTAIGRLSFDAENTQT